METIDAFGCGHPRTKENTQWAAGRAICKTCHRQHETASRRRRRQSETPSERHQRYRVTYLPEQIEATRRKLAMLENEARRYGMHDLLTQRETSQ